MEKEGLPRWDLSRLYPGIDSPEMEADRNEIQTLTDDFVAAYEGRVARLSGLELGNAVVAYEKICALRHKIDAYLLLLEAEDIANAARTGPVRTGQSEVWDHLSFFEGEISELPEAELLTRMAAPELAQYAPWIGRVRAAGNEGLPAGIEAASQEFAEKNIEAWRRLYKITMADLRVDFGGRIFSFDAAADKLADHDLTLTERRELRAALGAVLKRESRSVAFIYNTLVQDEVLESDIRKYPRPEQQAHARNGISPAAAQAMLQAAKRGGQSLSHRFYAWKAARHGQEIVEKALVSAPLPGDPAAAGRLYPWSEAKDIVFKSFRRFSARFARLAQKFFDGNYIDAEQRPGKESGGFALPTGPAHFPYIHINYTGQMQDVPALLGHELGHGVHFALSEKARGMFLSDMPASIAETASIFAEMLVFDYLLKSEKDPLLRRKLLVGQVENMLSNGLLQLAYYDFETRVHEKSRQGALDAEKISDLWEASLKGYYGPSVELDSYDRYYWMTVPHFFEMPFYVHSYSFAQIMVAGLYQAYAEAEAEGPAAKKDFVGKYIELLETGLTRNMQDMFRPFGLDPETPDFWEKGFALIGKYIDRLEKDDIPAAPKRKPKRDLDI